MKFSNILCKNLLLFATTCHAINFKSYSNGSNSSDSSIQPKCFKSEYNIYSAGDLAAISDCAVLSGNLHISHFDMDTIHLGSIKEIKGDFTVRNISNLIRIEATSLTSIGKIFELNTLNSLTSLSFPKLESVETMKWQVLPILTFVNLDTGIKTINSVILSDTSLTGFGGFNVDTLHTLSINNNRFLENIESSVSEITGDLLIAANARNIKVSLPNLTWVKSMTIKDTEEINLDSLQVIEKSADFSNNKFKALHLPKLKSTGTTLSIINNKKLDDIEFDNLSEVGGGLMIIDNEKIKKIDFFPSLRSVGGAIEFHGDISSNHFDDLKIIKGSAILKSSSDLFDCSDWMKNEVGRVVRGGKVECGSGKSQTTEVILVDESGESTQGEPGINNNNKNASRNENSVNQKSEANRSKFSLKFATVIAAYSFGMLLQML